MSLQIWTHTRLQEIFIPRGRLSGEKIFFRSFPGGLSGEKKYSEASEYFFSPESGSGRSGDLWAGRTPSLDHGFSIAPVVINRLDASLEVSNTLVDSSTRLLPNSDRI